MSRSRPSGSRAGKQTRPAPKAPVKSPEEKSQSRYIFGCVALILYVMPALSCLGLAMVMGGNLLYLAVGMAVSVLSVGLGLLGLHLYKKKKGRRLLGLCSAVLALCHVVCALLLGGWYLVMAPQFVLILVCVSGAGILEA